MKKKSKINFTLIRPIFVLLVMALSLVTLTASHYSDTEISPGNTFAAGTLDIILTSGQNNFVPDADDLHPDDSVARDIYITARPDNLDLQHQVSYAFDSGNSALCDQLHLKIWYNHYHGPVSGGYVNRDMRLTYDGPLTALANFQDPDFIIPHPDDQYDDNPADGLTQWYYYQITMPPAPTLDPILQGQQCNFDFIVDAWQADQPDNTTGFTDTESIATSLQTGTWDDADDPVSSITTTTAIQPNSTFDVDYSATDTTAVSTVELYYSYQGGPWNFYAFDSLSPVPSVTGTFTFTAPDGDGVYQFKTIATDIFAYTETKTGHDYDTLLDITPPIITASLGEFNADRITPSYQHTSDFETALAPWTTGTDNPATLTAGVAWASVRGGQSAFLNISDPVHASYLSSPFSIPVTSTDTLLSFWYNLKLLNGPTVSDFTVKVFETANPSNSQIILTHANDNPGTPYISGWQELSFQLTAWYGQNVTIEFSLADKSALPDAQVLVDDITLTSTPHTIATDKLIVFNSYDYGSGFLLDGSGLPILSEYKLDSGSWTQITGPLDPPPGPHLVYYRTTDEAGHSSGELKLDLINSHEPESLPEPLSEPSPTPTATPAPDCSLMTIQSDSSETIELCIKLEELIENQSVRLTISDLPPEENLEYQLIYLYNDQEQAVFATQALPVIGNTITREFELATCSGDDCIYHDPDDLTLDIIIIMNGQEYSGQQVFNL